MLIFTNKKSMIPKSLSEYKGLSVRKRNFEIRFYHGILINPIFPVNLDSENIFSGIGMEDPGKKTNNG